MTTPPARITWHDPPRVLYVTWVSGEDGGAVHVRETAMELEDLGCRVQVLWHRGAPGRTGPWPKPGRRKPRWLARLLHEPREFLRSVPGFFREMRAVRSFSPDWILSRYTYGKWTSSMTSLVSGRPVLLEINCLYDAENRVYCPEYLHYSALFRWVERLLIRKSVGVTVVSQVLCDDLRRKYGVSEDRILVNPNGGRMPPELPMAERERLLRSLGAGPGPRVVFAGSFQNFHGIGLLASAAERLLEEDGKAEFLFLGDGPERKRLEDLRRRHPDRVALPGRLPAEEARAILGICQVGVLPDCLPYGSPLKLFEYAAAGLGVVAPDYASVREIVRDGESALLFPPGDGAGLADRLRRMIGSEDLRTHLGKAAREVVLSRYSWRQNAERVLSFARERVPGGAPR